MQGVREALLQRVGSTENYGMYLEEVDMWRKEIGKVIGKVMGLRAELLDLVLLWIKHLETMERTG